MGEAASEMHVLKLRANLQTQVTMLVPDAETILDAADLARDAGFANASDRPLIAVIFFALLCLEVWLGDRQKEPWKL